MTKAHMGMILKVCSGYPTIYNIVSRLLYKKFKLTGAELTLLCTYVVIMVIKDFPELAKEVANDT